ncbi:MAG: DUF1294 domain-containing protein [Planctomycetes bacterium]|nr:DUF1294 domain-containing protein [Planctomycetota bacterium]
MSFLLVAAGLAVLVWAAGTWVSFPWPVGLLAGVNVAMLALYGYDKAVAGGLRTRVPEAVLHLVALAGGSPAALLGQVAFRHKTRKGSFRAVFWAIVALQLAGVLAWSCRR